jgi:PAS domain S-box-containing protein
VRALPTRGFESSIPNRKVRPDVSPTDPAGGAPAPAAPAASAAPPAAATDAITQSLKSLDELRYALDQAAIVAATDHRGIITYVNDKFCDISKYSRQELLGADHRIINSGYHPKAFIRELWRTIARGQVWRGEIRNRAKDGSFYWVDTTIVPFLDGAGKPRQYLAIRSDITARKLAEAKLREQAALTNLGQLTAVVAHEVRNPLAGLRASLQVLRQRCADPRDREIIGAMVQRIDDLNDKVEDLLLYARPKPPRLQALDVGALVRDAAQSARATTGSLCPPITVSAEKAVTALADADMLRAAVLNIAMNACQAAGARPVEIRISSESGVCRITIEDHGPGIPADVRERMFEPFFTTRAGGTGLGLAIVKRLIELLNGTVVLTDRRGGGTAAEISLPAAPGTRIPNP